MPLRDVLKKRSNIQGDATSTRSTSANSLPNLPNPVPEFTFMRTTTHEQEVIIPPSYPGDEVLPAPEQVPTEKKRRNIFRKGSASFVSTLSSNTSLPSHFEEKEPPAALPARPKTRPQTLRETAFWQIKGSLQERE
jgi:hypothetical protein